MIRRSALIFVVTIACLLFGVKTTYAAALSEFSDTISTSRPSAATPLASDQTAGAGSATIISDTQNYSIFIASDSATFLPDTGESINNDVKVASMSALNIPSAGERIVYFTNTISNAHHQGDTVIVPITAMHTIQFTTATSIPSGGKIIITFPGTGVNNASPSAQTFSFNGLNTSNASTLIQTNNATSCTWAVTAPSITCTTSGVIAGGTVVTFLVGCLTQSSGSCTSQSPVLINPTKNTANAQSGASATTTADDNWRVNVKTQDASSVELDNSTTTIGIIESVQVQASVDPTLTFTITGLASNTNLSSGHGASCVDTTNSGIDTTATFVNLGILTASKINLAAQDLSVATNEAAGYTLTATSSGHLINPNSGYSISDPGTTPAVMAVGTEDFGIHACGSHANASFVPASGLCTSAACTTAGSGKIAWPTATSPLTIASFGNITSGTITTVEYASTVSGTTPAGIYNSVITYVATPTFN